MNIELMKCLTIGCENKVERHPFDTLNGNCNECKINILESLIQDEWKE